MIPETEKMQHLRRERLYQVALREKAEAAIRDLDEQIEQEELRTLEAVIRSGEQA